MFADHINTSLPKADLHLLMDRVLAAFKEELIHLHQPFLTAMLDLELLEHWLCEWKKAKCLEAKLLKTKSQQFAKTHSSKRH